MCRIQYSRALREGRCLLRYCVHARRDRSQLAVPPAGQPVRPVARSAQMLNVFGIYSLASAGSLSPLLCAHGVRFYIRLSCVQSLRSQHGRLNHDCNGCARHISTCSPTHFHSCNSILQPDKTSQTCCGIAAADPHATPCRHNWSGGTSRPLPLTQWPATLSSTPTHFCLRSSRLICMWRATSLHSSREMLEA